MTKHDKSELKKHRPCLHSWFLSVKMITNDDTKPIGDGLFHCRYCTEYRVKLEGIDIAMEKLGEAYIALSEHYTS